MDTLAKTGNAWPPGFPAIFGDNGIELTDVVNGDRAVSAGFEGSCSGAKGGMRGGGVVVLVVGFGAVYDVFVTRTTTTEISTKGISCHLCANDRMRGSLWAYCQCCLLRSQHYQGFLQPGRQSVQLNRYCAHA